MKPFRLSLALLAGLALIPSLAHSADLKLTWTDVATNEDAYQVERSLAATGGFAKIADLPANSSAYTDTGLAEGTQYFYRVSCSNSAGKSAYSNVANGTTKVTTPPAATGLTVTPL